MLTCPRTPNITLQLHNFIKLEKSCPTDMKAFAEHAAAKFASAPKSASA